MICEQTDIVLNVYGMSAVGKKLKEGCFRDERRPGRFSERTEEDILCPEILSHLR